MYHLVFHFTVQDPDYQLLHGVSEIFKEIIFCYPEKWKIKLNHYIHYRQRFYGRHKLI